MLLSTLPWNDRDDGCISPLDGFKVDALAAAEYPTYPANSSATGLNDAGRRMAFPPSRSLRGVWTASLRLEGRSRTSCVAVGGKRYSSGEGAGCEKQNGRPSWVRWRGSGPRWVRGESRPVPVRSQLRVCHGVDLFHVPLALTASSTSPHPRPHQR
ncbi:hypothetical protein B0T18DRAFT_61719 [Schizothecium vesticola]|uniref:Uncharacterized protein n=1 Tax=Schizothecium vesticola TaxID=314040 RepID=A0AA40F4I3_9PEZI|nr:hypothetical protein B0T18DRAFT_61719 [Schizothecium vesticola]